MDNKKASVALLHTALVETIPQGLVPVRTFLLVGLPGLVLSPVELSVLVFVDVVKEPLPCGSRRIPLRTSMPPHPRPCQRWRRIPSPRRWVRTFWVCRAFFHRPSDLRDARVQYLNPVIEPAAI